MRRILQVAGCPIAKIPEPIVDCAQRDRQIGKRYHHWCRSTLWRRRKVDVAHIANIALAVAIGIQLVLVIVQRTIVA